MGQTAWRCEHPETGDVKYGARYDHVLELESRGYVCTLDPDLDMKTETIYSLDKEE